MHTKWGDALDTEHPLPEYPRPQLVRKSYRSLNGPWRYAVTKQSRPPEHADGTIIVPFPPESPLSGAGHILQPDEYLWYIRSFELPPDFNEGRVLLHFGAVDQTAAVWCNGVELASHTGGYLPFTVELTDVLARRNTIMVCVRDQTDTGYCAYGRQALRPRGLRHTPWSGIWQSVWLESVPKNYIRGLVVTPHFDEACVELLVQGEGRCILELEGRRYALRAGTPVRVPVENMEPWTPEHPKLYRFRVRLGEDEVESYFAMRCCTVEPDEDGRLRLCLNHRPYFHNGVYTQGLWSDGLCTPPSDEALLFDIQAAKAMGFNMLRMHMKVETERWYYHCDRLGMLVWQDMPCGGEHAGGLASKAPKLTGQHLDDRLYPLFGRRSAAGREAFLKELQSVVAALYNHPCIVMWVPFHEGWGQFDSQTAVQTIEALDRTRTIDPASGWHDQGFGRLQSVHAFGGSYRFRPDRLGRAVLLSGWGGIAHRVEGHAEGGACRARKLCISPNSLEFTINTLFGEEIRPAIAEGLAAAVYLQLTDAEGERTGLITYDRRVTKLPLQTLRRIFAPEKK